jgi:8-oxo-dGTP pyrophosphatase MutT (NUDIX family)
MNKLDITVYFSEHKIVFIDKQAKNLYQQEEKTAFNAKYLAEVVKTSGKNHFVVCDNLHDDFKKFSKQFTLIEAAGGLIKNDKNQYLFIYRHNKWDLPKGKLDDNETPEHAAVRECREECGLQDITLQDFITNTYHIYLLRNEWILKKTYWYNMLCNETNLIPQVEEHITEAAWKSKSDIAAMLSNTYQNIIDILKKADLI